jgi:hypothetical protein
VLIIAGLPFFFLEIGPGPGSPVTQLYGFAHLFFFALSAWWLARWIRWSQRPFWYRALLVMLLLAGLGGAIELIQPHFGRGASWRDFGIDILGGLLGLFCLAPDRRHIRRLFLLSAQFFILAAITATFYGPLVTLWDMCQASRQFPVLSDFETRFEARRWSSGEISKSVSRRGHNSLRVLLDKGNYPGTTLQRSFGNWQGYTRFSFSLYLPDETPLRITVSIRDHDHNRRGGEFHDRFNRTFTMRQGWNDIVIPISDIERAPVERTLALDRLSEVVIFTTNLPAPRVVYIDDVRLTGRG